MHPYSRVHFERLHDTPMSDALPAASEPVEQEAPVVVERKKPRTHPKEKLALSERRKLAYKEEDEKLQEQMNAMVLEYLDMDEGLKNLPPTEDTKPMGEEEGDFVYDVYVLDAEAPAEAEREASHGVLVFEDDDDQEWWYEEAAKAEDADDSDVYAEDDEDSNGNSNPE